MNSISIPDTVLLARQSFTVTVLFLSSSRDAT
jgi:hypothetical protein